MKIYRVEHMSLLSSKGHPAGPYAEAAWENAECADVGFQFCSGECGHSYIGNLCCDTPSNRPVPSNDGLPWYFDDDELFGFQSIEALREWFYGDLKMLHRLGYIVAVYDVPDQRAKHGFHQSVFDWSVSTRMDEFPITDTWTKKLRSAS